MILEQIVERLDELAKNRGGLAKLVQDSGISERTIQYIKNRTSGNGTCNPTIGVIEALVKGLGMQMILVNEVERKVLGQYRIDARLAKEDRERGYNSRPIGGCVTGRVSSEEIDKPRRSEEED